jgi:hypothetical protein
MNMRYRSILLLSCASMGLALSACGPADGDPAAGGVSASDAEALDEAAEKLDRRDIEAAKEQAD